MPGRLISQVGARYGRLVVEREEFVSAFGRTVRFAHCLCDCGARVRRTLNSLRSTHTKSCGCLHLDAATAACLSRTKHGDSRRGRMSPEYRSWLELVKRSRGGGTGMTPVRYKGITCCDSWLAFENFLADMGRKPTPAHSIDRIDNSRGYEPVNCRWATMKEQSNNRRPWGSVTRGGVPCL